MLECAVDGVELLAVDPREALRDGPSYTVDTLEAIHAEHPEATLIFCMGLDAFIRNGVTGVIARRSVTALAISATGLRADLQAQRSIRFLVPERVHGYIDRRGLYRETAASPS